MTRALAAPDARRIPEQRKAYSKSRSGLSSPWFVVENFRRIFPLAACTLRRIHQAEGLFVEIIKDQVIPEAA